MRAQRCVSPVSAVVGVTQEGKITKPNIHHHHQRTAEGSAEVLVYLERLQHLVPQCPKDRPVTKLELIQSVIDYIYDLEDALSNASDEEEEDGMSSSSSSCGDDLLMDCVESS